ncbi:RsmB/NOP family class I SAM-dependent RNA methyltransferase [Sphingomonas sp. HF-S4]|uniref:RsmB/NOP family class I SAM-dependent RNA methyltransferase n=1 Tax=Sphingomonas agrestis TaxID=3080540 RepID=A0ABU3Y4X6_9SPHN|nr:RsmB/NOP family class I SAM-dependent RNA methyltransferase [Sphingomonas sp. HF-S4]MDV3456414.1 RsmB/NOP family class I SAM-dependent RNA methyltransferase [Sphingomonas sp. HF-S4]
MTPAARTQAAIDLLDRIIAAARDQGAAADTLIARWFAERRFAGSKDRRAVRELIYDAIRRCGERPESGRAAMLALVAERPELAATFDGSPYGPATIEAGEPVATAGHAPGWLIKKLRASDIGIEEQAALLDRAPLDIRVNRLKATREEIAAALPGAEPLGFAPDGLRLPADTRVDQLSAYAEGRFEVQDAGSQVVTLAAGAEPGQRVVDLCAGGGGKTLALAALMANRGSILACDVDRGRLQRLPERAVRAGVTMAETRLLNPNREAEQLGDQVVGSDIVLVDAPCSGTGTWRRNPEARWRLTHERLDKLVATQRHIMGLAAELVRPGGALVYIVCSVLDDEGASQVQAFLNAYSGWTVETLALGAGRPRGAGVRLTPLGDSTDGFFVAKMIRP